VIHETERSDEPSFRGIPARLDAELLTAAEVRHAAVLRNPEHDGLDASGDGARRPLRFSDGARQEKGRKDCRSTHQAYSFSVGPGMESALKAQLEEYNMSRSRVSRQTMRALGPVVIPLVTRIAIPIALESLRKRKFAADDFVGESEDTLKENIKKTRSDIDEVKDEAVSRGKKLYDEARREGTEFLEVLLRKGLGIANEWAQSLGEPQVKRRRFRLGPVIALVALVGTGLVLVSRR
jgi:hypothetical protein